MHQESISTKANMHPNKPHPTKKIRPDGDDSNENPKASKVSVDVPNIPPPGPTTHSVAMAATRDAIVAFGAGHDALLLTIERRIAKYLWHSQKEEERLFRCGGT